MNTGITQAAYAVSKGWSKQYVSKLVRQGKISTVGGRIDPELADRQLAAQADPSRRLDQAALPIEPDEAAPRPEGRSISFNTARTARETFLAKSAELDLQERLGSLLDRGEIEDVFAWLQQTVSEGLLQRTELLAARLSALAPEQQVDAAVVAQIIREEDRKILHRMQDGFLEAAAMSAGAAAA